MSGLQGEVAIRPHADKDSKIISRYLASHSQHARMTHRLRLVANARKCSLKEAVITEDLFPKHMPRVE